MSARRPHLLYALAALTMAAGCGTPLTADLGAVSIRTGAAGLRGLTALAEQPNLRDVAKIPVMDRPGATIVGKIALPGLRTQAQLQRLSSDITFYEVELIADQGATGAADYSNATLTAASAIKGSVFLDGPAAGQPAGTLADGLTSGLFAFTNVPPGSYRVRIRAKADATTPGSTVINNPDAFFTPNNSGWEISDNTATVTNGSSLVSYTAPDSAKLVANLTLQSGFGETVSVGLNPMPGAAIPTITSTNF